MTTNEAVESWTVSVDEEGVLVFPDELINKMDWKEGDLIEWIEKDDGSIILTKYEQSEDDDGSERTTSTIDACPYRVGSEGAGE